MSSPEKRFHTTDVDLAAYLVCKGQPLLEILPPDRPPPFICDFVFVDSAATFECLREWGSDEGGRLVDALEFSKQRIRLYKRARTLLDEMRGR